MVCVKYKFSGGRFTSFENERKGQEKGGTKVLTLRFVVVRGCLKRRKKAEGMIKGYTP